MSEQNDATYLYQWVSDTKSGLSAHLNYHVQNNSPKVSQLAQAYRQLKKELGY